MQDGAPCHRRAIVPDFLGENVQEGVISIGRKIKWPARSLVLTPSDLFLRGQMKQVVYATPPQDLVELRDRFNYHVDAIRENPQLIRNVYI